MSEYYIENLWPAPDPGQFNCLYQYWQFPYQPEHTGNAWQNFTKMRIATLWHPCFKTYICDKITQQNIRT